MPWLQGPGRRAGEVGQGFQGPAPTPLLASLLDGSGRHWQGQWGQGDGHCPAPWALACRGLGGGHLRGAHSATLTLAVRQAVTAQRALCPGHRALWPRSVQSPHRLCFRGHQGREESTGSLGPGLSLHTADANRLRGLVETAPARLQFPHKPLSGQPPAPRTREQQGDRGRQSQGGRGLCVRVRASTHVPAHGSAQGVCVCMCTPRRVCPGLRCADARPGTSPLHPSTPHPAATRPRQPPAATRAPDSSAPLPAWASSPLRCSPRC